MSDTIGDRCFTFILSILFPLFFLLPTSPIRKKPKEEFGIDSYIVVDNVPQIGVERLEKLQGVIKKIFSKFGPIQNEHWPTEGEGDEKKTKVGSCANDAVLCWLHEMIALGEEIHCDSIPCRAAARV